MQRGGQGAGAEARSSTHTAGAQTDSAGPPITKLRVGEHAQICGQSREVRLSFGALGGRRRRDRSKAGCRCRARRSSRSINCGPRRHNPEIPSACTFRRDPFAGGVQPSQDGRNARKLRQIAGQRHGLGRPSVERERQCPSCASLASAHAGARRRVRTSCFGGKALTSVIPPAGQNLVRYFGVLGPAAKLRSAIVHQPKVDPADPPDGRSPKVSQRHRASTGRRCRGGSSASTPSPAPAVGGYEASPSSRILE